MIMHFFQLFLSVDVFLADRAAAPRRAPLPAFSHRSKLLVFENVQQLQYYERARALRTRRLRNVARQFVWCKKRHARPGSNCACMLITYRYIRCYMCMYFYIRLNGQIDSMCLDLRIKFLLTKNILGVCSIVVFNTTPLRSLNKYYSASTI